MSDDFTIALPDGTERNFSREARGVIRGTYAGKITRYHLLAMAYEIEDLNEEIRRLNAAGECAPGQLTSPSVAPAERVLQQ